MEFYIMQRGVFEKIPPSERKQQATFFEAYGEDGLNVLRSQVEFANGEPAGDTRFKKIKPGQEQRIKVCGPCIFRGKPIGVEEIGNNNWGHSGDYYLKTEIVPGKLYCYSWIAGDSEEEAVCVSFEILSRNRQKKK